MSRGPVTDEDVWEIEGGRDPAAKARALLALAADPHPDDEPNRAQLLTIAAEHLGYAGDHAAALEYFREAAATGEPVPPDVRGYLLRGLLAVGRAEEADDLARDIRASRPEDPLVHCQVGEVFESHGDLPAAHRWFTIGLNKAIDAQADDDHDEIVHTALDLLAAGRHRVRRELGLPLDELDLFSEELAEDAAED